MDLIIQKFVSHYTELFAEHNEKFLEDNGRCLFLLYVKTIISQVKRDTPEKVIVAIKKCAS